MKIYLMRHGEAGFNAPNDNLRELTDNGRERIKWNILQKFDELLTVDDFFSSPILRAKQTAELASALLRRCDPIIDVDWLIHDSHPAQAIIELGRLKTSSIMLFSHQPFSSRLVELLCDLDAGAINLNTGSIVAMEVDPVLSGCGNVLWQLS